jgi:hypothetical protein
MSLLCYSDTDCIQRNPRRFGQPSTGLSNLLEFSVSCIFPLFRQTTPGGIRILFGRLPGSKRGSTSSSPSTHEGLVNFVPLQIHLLPLRIFTNLPSFFAMSTKGRVNPRIVCCAIPIARAAGKVLVITSRKRQDQWVCEYSIRTLYFSDWRSACHLVLVCHGVTC